MQAEPSVTPSHSDRDSAANHGVEVEEGHSRMRTRTRLNAMKLRLEDIGLVQVRRQRWMVWFTLELASTIIAAFFYAYYNIGGPTVDVDTVGTLVLSLHVTSMVSMMAGNLQVTDKWTMLLLFVHMDTIMPALAVACTGFYIIIDFTPEWHWTTYAVAFYYPIFLLIIAATLRVHILCEELSRTKIVLYKLSLFLTGLVYFMIGWAFINGSYKFSDGQLPQLENTFKNILYLFVFGMTDYMYELVRRMSDFDQTSQLRSEYEFKSYAERQTGHVRRVEIKHAERQAELQCLIEDILVGRVQPEAMSSSEGPSSINTSSGIDAPQEHELPVQPSATGQRGQVGAAS